MFKSRAYIAVLPIFPKHQIPSSQRSMLLINRKGKSNARCSALNKANSKAYASQGLFCLRTRISQDAAEYYSLLGSLVYKSPP